MIYFVQQESTTYIKIGFTRGIQLRLKGLKSKYGAVTLLAVMDGGMNIEASTQLMFASIRVAQDGYGKEWFKPETILLDYIKQHGRQLTPADKPGNRSITFSVTTEMYQQFNDLAASMHVPVSELLREAVVQYISRP